MKKRMTVLTVTVVVVFAIITWFLIGGKGNTSECERIIGESVIYSAAEINQMMDLVEKTFRNEFQGCYLIQLTYDETLSSLYCEDWAAIYEADQAVVLTSVFDVSASGGDGSLNPNSTYSNWQWILTRNGQEDWVLRTWGY